MDSSVHMPICRPSGEQIESPAVVQEPVEEPVGVMPEPEAGAALEPDELAAGAGAELAEGEAMTEGEAAATEGEAATAGAATDIEGAVAGAASPEDPGLPVLVEAPDELPDAPHFGPVGGARTFALLALAFSTEAPGSGNLTSAPCSVVQSDTGILATNMAGKEAVARSESSEIAYS